MDFPFFPKTAETIEMINLTKRLILSEGRFLESSKELVASYGREMQHRQEIIELKKNLFALDDTARSRYDSLQSTEAKCQELIGQLAAMRQERDDIQLRLHAVDHAFNEQQRSPALADALKHNLELTKTLKRQREFIRTLYTSRKARKAKGSTSAQVRPGNALEADSSGQIAGLCAYRGMHKHYQAGCPHCGAGPFAEEHP